VPAYLGQVAAELDRLVPPDFIRTYPADRIVRLPRQLEAVKFRLARARLDPEKDRAKAAQVEPWEEALARLEEEVAESGASAPNEERRRAVEELRRMVEEFKVSLFAPEIRTAFPISAIRLARKVKEIEGIV